MNIWVLGVKAYSDKNIVFAGIFALLLFAYLSFALPTVTFQPPTLQDNSYIGRNYTWINMTISLNESNYGLLYKHAKLGTLTTGIIYALGRLS